MSIETEGLPIYEAVIKINVRDEAKLRARDIAEGVGYAICLLQDEYGWSADEIESAVQPHVDDAYDREEQRCDAAVPEERGG